MPSSTHIRSMMFGAMLLLVAVALGWLIAMGTSTRQPDEASSLAAIKARLARLESEVEVLRWRAQSPPVAVPELTYSKANGCGNVFIYACTADGREFVVVSADRDALGLSTDEKEFDLSVPNPAIEVRIDLYSQRPDEPYCTDVAPAPGSEWQTATWTARKGRMRIVLFPPEPVVPGRQPVYRARVQLEGCEFSDGIGRAVSQTEPLVFEALVGWLAG